MDRLVIRIRRKYARELGVLREFIWKSDICIVHQKSVYEKVIRTESEQNFRQK